MSMLASENEIIAVLTIRDSEGRNRSLPIRNGQRLIIGTDAGADIRLTDDVVAAVHCVISADGGILIAKDCFTQAGTFVDDLKIRETKLNDTSEIRIGTTVISVQSGGAGTQDFETQNGSNLPAFGCRDDSPTQTSADTHANLRQPNEEAVSPFQAMDAMQSRLDEAYAEIEVLHDRLKIAGAVSGVSASNDSGSNPPVDPYQEEMIDLLRAEVLELQSALDEREELTSGSSTESATGIRVSAETDDDHCLPQADADRLVSRLEDLLVELQQRDEQVAMLTELLAATEETSRAEQEQVRHLNSWFADIEAKFGDREHHWQAQLEALQQRLNAMTAERDLAALAVTTDTSNAKLEATQKLMQGLRETVESQQQQLAASEQAIAKLRSEKSAGQAQVSREELVRLAEERAEIARQRQELEALRANEQRRGSSSDSVLKLQALRQHLNEIHEQEQAEREERKFSNRIARLWSRLDGRS